MVRDPKPESFPSSPENGSAGKAPVSHRNAPAPCRPSLLQSRQHMVSHPAWATGRVVVGAMSLFRNLAVFRNKSGEFQVFRGGGRGASLSHRGGFVRPAAVHIPWSPRAMQIRVRGCASLFAHRHTIMKASFQRVRRHAKTPHCRAAPIFALHCAGREEVEPPLSLFLCIPVYFCVFYCK